jgi:general secretion pathway protein M
MTTDHFIQRTLSRYPWLGVIAYGVVLIGLLLLSWTAVADILDRRAALEAAGDMLARLEGRRPAAKRDTDASSDPVPSGSPFLEGQTITVAGAALLQRVAGAVARVGGNVLSSQVEFQGTQSRDGYVSLIASCEIEHTALQPLLYDLEAGMPFLFVDQLVAQAPAASAEGGRTRVLLAVSGLWPGGK